MCAMIVAPEPTAVEAGARVLMTGGNAVDAAVTSALVQGIVSPHDCGIGGYALLTMHLPVAAGQAEGGAVALDAPALAGSQVTPAMWQDLVLRPNPDGWGYFLQGKVNDVGYRSICVPGTVKALAAMLERWGSLSWQEALQPAIRTAMEGHRVNGVMAARWKEKAAYVEASSLRDYIDSNAEAARIYLKRDDSTYDAGELLHNPDYGRTLSRLAEQGAEDFYQGDLAQQISADLAFNDSYVTAADLAAYRLQDVEPLRGSYRGYGVVTAPPPHGGPTLLAILNILEGYDLGAMVHNSPEYIYLVSMAMKAAFADRNPYLGDPGHVDLPLDWMLSKERGAEWRQRIDQGTPFQVLFTPSEGPDTTHVTVVDDRGCCVALTHSLGASSGVITPGLGFMYNNSMTNFHPWPGHANSIAPGKGRTTGMAPTIVYAGERPLLVLGSPGATRIITSNLQVMLNLLDFGMSVSDAVAAPRFDCQGDQIRCQARIPDYICAQVAARHPVERLPHSHGGMARVHAITIDPTSGRLAGGADPGSAGMALEV